MTKFKVKEVLLIRKNGKLLEVLPPGPPPVFCPRPLEGTVFNL